MISDGLRHRIGELARTTVVRRGQPPEPREGIGVDYMRIRGFPFGDEVIDFLEAHEINFIVEQNRDAQLRSLLLLETGVAIEKLASVRYYGGFPMSAHHVITGVKGKIERAA